MTKPKLLISEDEVIIAEDIAACLEDLGYETCAIDTGEDTLDMIRETRPDLVLLDINLKGSADGVDIGSQIKKEFDIPFIYLTFRRKEPAFYYRNCALQARPQP